MPRPILGSFLQWKIDSLTRKNATLELKEVCPEVRHFFLQEKEAIISHHTNMSDFDRGTLFKKYLLKSLILEVFHTQWYSILTKALEEKHCRAHFFRWENKLKDIMLLLQISSKVNCLASVSLSGQIRCLTRGSCNLQSLGFYEAKWANMIVSLVISSPCHITWEIHLDFLVPHLNLVIIKIHLLSICPLQRCKTASLSQSCTIVLCYDDRSKSK